MQDLPDREFTFTDSELTIKVSQVVDAMERDEAEFITRGVTALDRQAFETLGNDFEELLPDDYYRGRVVSATATKDTAEEETFRLVQKVSGFVQQKFGAGSGEYISLKVKGYGGKTEDGKLKASRTVAKVAELLLSDLTGVGLTQADIDDLRAKAQEFEDGIDLIAEREGQRKNATFDRVTKANELYDLLSKYCEIGKLIWENVNPAFYDDYVIYKTVHHGLGKPQNLNAAPDPQDPQTAVLTWDAVQGATDYRVFFSETGLGAPSGNFGEIGTSQGANMFNAPIMPNRENYWKIKATNGTLSSAFSDEVQWTG